MTFGTRRPRVCVAHRPADLEAPIARPAAELVQGHRPDRTAGRRGRTAWRLALAAALASAVAAGVASGPATATPGEPWLVTDVVDGDTIDVARGDTRMTVRLIGINTPERGECWYAEATEALVELVGSGPVWLYVDTTDVDQFDRALRYVVNADHDDVGGLLVEQGAAIARSYPPDTANDDRYALLQEAARRDSRGLWAPDACGAAPTGSSQSAVGLATGVVIEIHPDAAGDDNANLNDEWVRFVNAGNAPLDLAGWVVRDESSAHRYTFADLVLPPDGVVTLFTGCGVDNPTERYWCRAGSAVWNNGGDTVFLLDPAGNIAVSRTY
ncbi:MAG TPA: lamin tail domain-containing protein [Desertimonas sp.]|nr:lamin tail domain-containing protein [Desertimonas sp.]